MITHLSKKNKPQIIDISKKKLLKELQLRKVQLYFQKKHLKN